MNRYFTKPFLLLSVLFLAPWAHALRQPGAPRLLVVRLNEERTPLSPVNTAGAAAVSLAQAAVGPRNRADGTYPLYFTRIGGSSGPDARNLFRASLRLERGDDEENSAENLDETSGDARIVTRIAPLDGAPLTRLAAPLFASNAAPLPDGRTILCLTNALLSPFERRAGSDQIARLDLRSGAMRALSPAALHRGALAISPDGGAVAFSAERAGTPEILLMPIAGGRVRRVASFARNAAWLDDATLVYESVRDGAVGIARRDLQSDAGAQIVWPRGGETTALSARICVAVSPHSAPNSAASRDKNVSRLYFLAADGSGARALPGSDGAAAPSFAPDGSFLVFDAPAQKENASIEEGSTVVFDRTLWAVPMRRVAPVARLDALRPAGSGFDIIGTAYSEDNAPRALLEWGEGRAPARWNTLPLSQLPAHNATLARWTPPAARGEWTLRLSVTDGEGDRGQSEMAVTLPIETSAVAPPPVFALAPVPVLPLPALPSPPVPAPSTPQPAPRDRAPEGASPPPPVSSPPAPQPVPAPKRPAPKPRPTPKPKPTPAPRPAPQPAPTTTGDAAVLTVSGIPYDVAPGEDVKLSAALRNTGRNGWKTSGDSAVRLLVRWHDARTKTRTRWAVRWLRADVAPGTTGKLDFSVPAPTRPGNYILRFSLVRVGRDGYTPPPFSQTDSDRYPGEFGVATTTMPVRPQ